MSLESNRNQVSVDRVILAPPEAIFDLLADPDRHAEIDGGGTVQKSRSGSRRLKLGDTFGMDMKLGVAYSTRNVVVEFEENRRIAWQTLAAAPMDKFVTGRIWRYDLQPVDGGTRVTETWDISTEALLSRPLVRLAMAGKTRENITRTLERIAEIVTA
ncbi:MAG: SRPBCC family protein [Nocardioides sp.]